MPTALRDRRLVKAAAGDAQTFENSLATIGRQYLTAKAPGLAQHEIGFQVLDSDDDNTRAVGVFGFRVGDRLLYVPMFYRDGTVKGTEQLRDPKRKTCVPLTDNWVNKYLSDQGDDPPTRISRAQTRDTAMPSLWQLKYPPSKFASDARSAIKADLARAIGGKPRPPGAGAPDLLKCAAECPELLAGIGRLAVAYPWFSAALGRYHGQAKVAAALAKVTAPKPKVPGGILAPRPKSVVPPAPKAAAVTIVSVRSVRLDRDPLHPKADFPAHELDELKAGRNVYRDERPDDKVTKITGWIGGLDDTRERFKNPDSHGIYEVLGEKHEVHPCAVFMPLVGWGPSVGRCLVIRLSDGAWAYTHPNAVWVRGESADQNALHKWIESKPEAKDEIPEGEYVAVGRVAGSRGPVGGTVTATVPFHQLADGSAAPIGYTGGKRPFWAAVNPIDERSEWYGGLMQPRTTVAPRYDPPFDGYNGSRADRSPLRVELVPDVDAARSRPRLSGNQLYLPAGTRLVKLTDEKLELGDGTDPERFLFMRRKEAKDRVVEVTKTAGGLAVADPRTDKVAAFPTAPEAEAHLVAAHGLRVADARRLVDTAVRTKTAAAFVKYADPYNLSHAFPSAPGIAFDQIASPAGFADDVVPTESAAGVAVPIQDMQMQPGAMDAYRPYPVDYGTKKPLPGIGNGGDPPPPGPSASDLEAVAGAARSGRRELFDTAAMAALVKHTRLQTLLDRVRVGMMREVTDLGDLLAHLYWNVDEWGEQFGETEVGPLEDQIRSQFDGLGELVLTLQEKNVADPIDAGIIPLQRPGDGADTES